MYRYRPPKSSVWGHKLRRMPILRAKTLLRSFLEAAASEYKLISTKLWIGRVDEGTIARYESKLGIRAERSRGTLLTTEQSEVCFAELVNDEAAFRSEGVLLTLWETFEVTRWRMQGSASATTSIIEMRYDIWPSLGTTLDFESVEQFGQIKNLMKEIGLCDLNEKHLKPVRSARKKATP